MSDRGPKAWGRRGASSVFALTVFLMATLFSVTMVSGALTTMQNASMSRVDERSYLCITSAARLFCEEASFSADYSLYGVPAEAYGVQALSLSEINGMGGWSFDGTGETVVQKAFREMMPKADKELNADDNTKTLTVLPPKDASGADISGFYAVKVTLSMDKEYTVTAKFEPADDDQSPRYYVSVTFGAEYLVDTFEPVDEFTNDLHRGIEWSVKAVERGRRS